MAPGREEIEFLETDVVSDDDVPEEAHNKLLNAVSQLYKKQRINAPKRREPAQEISEFNLSSNTEDRSNKVHVNELLKDLQEKVTHKELNFKVKAAQKKSRTLPKPLEQNEAKKINREIGYQTVRKNLNKWNSIVERSKLADQLVFPLEQKKVEMEAPNFLKTYKEPSELEKAMAAVLNQSEVAQEERKVEESLSNLSIEEMIERRRTMAKMRARESYRIAKAVRQNKIKSKKYHRILKKERIKQELKDFEKLQKTDPEAALAKLEQIERARAEERISLRHRNTGKWARSRAIRAKYDTEARMELADQLAKSRELTKKVNVNDSSSSECEMEDEDNKEDERINANSQSTSSLESGNPWVKETVVDEFLSGYKQFWSDKHQSELKDVESSEIEKNNELKTSDETFDKNVPITNSEVESINIGSNNVESDDLVLESTDLSAIKTNDEVSGVLNSETTITTNNTATSLEPSSGPELSLVHDKNAILSSTCQDSIAECSNENVSKNSLNDSSKKCDKNNELESADLNHFGIGDSPTCSQNRSTKLTQDVADVPKLLNSNIISSKPCRSPSNNIKSSKSRVGSPDKTSHLIDSSNTSTYKYVEKASTHNLASSETHSSDFNRKQFESSYDSQGSKSISENVVIDSSDSESNIDLVEASSSTSSSLLENDSDMGGETVATNSGLWCVVEGASNPRKRSHKQTLLTRKTKEKTLHELFDDAEEEILKRTSTFVKRIREETLDPVNNSEDVSHIDEEKESLFKLSQKLRKNHGIDEALLEIHEDGISSGVNDLKNIRDKLTCEDSVSTKEPQIDPNKHINVKPQKLFSEMGKLEEAGDESDDSNTQKMDLMEAFADDDIADQFRKEKDEESKKNKQQEIDLELPGWGSWGGCSIPKKSKRKRRRFIVKIPKVPRKDEKKEHIIINEDPVPKLREQLVNELPYPFTSVKDYEASIRAPIGKHWVPEKAYKKLIAPPVITRMGTIIEPMSNDVDLNVRKKKQKLK